MPITFFATNPVRLVFEASMRGLDYIFFNALEQRSANDAQLIEALKTADHMGIEVKNKPLWADKRLNDSHWETDLGI